ISFLKNIVKHPKVYAGNYNTTFIQDHPELFDFVHPLNKALKILKYIADVTVNGIPIIELDQKQKFATTEIPSLISTEKKIQITKYEPREIPSLKSTNKKIQSANKQSFRHLLDQEGQEAVSKAVLDTSNALLTDTTLRDAHQSLLTTRLRTQDMENIAPYMN